MKQYRVEAFLLSIIISFSFFSCSNSKNEIAAFKLLDESLIISNKNFERSTEGVYLSLKNKLEVPGTAEGAKIWFPKAEKVEQFSKDVINQIQIIKSEIEKENGLTTTKANQLSASLAAYKKNLLAIDPSIESNFRSNLVIISTSFDSMQDNNKNFAETFFNHIPVEAEKAMLDKFVNNIQIAENRLVTFCNEQMAIDAFIEDGHSTLSFIAQNSTILKPNELLEITAAVGSFNPAFNPRITINGNQIALNDQIVASKKIIVSKKPGKYSIPVEINYIDQNGHKQTVSKRLEYTVADCPTKEN